jgi:hypothetical protein
MGIKTKDLGVNLLFVDGESWRSKAVHGISRDCTILPETAWPAGRRDPQLTILDSNFCGMGSMRDLVYGNSTERQATKS